MKQQFARFAKYAVKSAACSTALLFAVPTTLHAALPQLWPMCNEVIPSRRSLQWASRPIKCHIRLRFVS